MSRTNRHHVPNGVLFSPSAGRRLTPTEAAVQQEAYCRGYTNGIFVDRDRIPTRGQRMVIAEINESLVRRASYHDEDINLIETDRLVHNIVLGGPDVC